MTAEDIIAANPEIVFRKGRGGLIGTRPDGSKFLTLWQGEYAVDCAYPVKAAAVQMMRETLRNANETKSAEP